MVSFYLATGQFTNIAERADGVDEAGAVATRGSLTP
jgi:hypothetical protein